MGWTDSHLHRFRTGRSYGAPYFVTHFDMSEGEDGVLEDDVRLDQVVAAPRAELWYEDDFGDGWQHAMTVEAVLDEAPRTARCIDGRLACPPEDCGRQRVAEQSAPSQGRPSACASPDCIVALNAGTCLA